MFSSFRRILIRITGLLALVLALSPASAFASGLPLGDDQETFDYANQVSDEELAGMRGGFIDINGVLLDFNFLSRVQVGLDVMNNVSVDTNNLAIAAMSATQIQDLIQPNIIQNMDNDTLISIQQALNLNIVNIDQLNQIAQLGQHSFQQGMGSF